MRKVWKVKPVEESLFRELTSSLDIPPLIARLLLHRGISSAEQARDFLCVDLSRLGDPSSMSGLPDAVHLIRQAVSKKEKIILVGDYDVDGLTGTAILFRTLRSMGADASCHIPHRMEDGYGLKKEVIRKAAAAGVKLLITVDCGTTSFDELRYARKMGLGTVVVDHHELLPAGCPPAGAFLNPLQPGCRYPEKELASAGVAFTLFRGLVEGDPGSKIWEHLDLAAMGTVADWAPLKGENRVLVKAGLHRIQGTDKVGLQRLLSQARLTSKALSTEDISFYLAPRINAVGRMGSAETSLKLLITEDPEEADRLAKTIEKENKNRIALERTAFQRAVSKMEREINFSRDKVIVLEDDEWHPGVIGIVASRLTARFHRPVVVIAANGTICRGSARSIPAFPLVEALEMVKEHLIEFGGHPGAAGFTIERERIPVFREALNRVAHERIDPSLLTRCLEMDDVLPLSSLNDEILRDMELLGPFGQGNPRPIFLSEDARIPEERREPPFSPFGVRFFVEDGEGRSFETLQSQYDAADGWNVRRLTAGPISLAYSPVRRRGAAGGSIELKLCDLKIQP